MYITRNNEIEADINWIYDKKYTLTQSNIEFLFTFQCGVETRIINETKPASSDSYVNTNGTEIMRSIEDNVITRTIKVRRHCCDGLVCKHEGADEEPVPPGVTEFCMDPEDEKRERMFDKWKKSLEMPRDYSYNARY